MDKNKLDDLERNLDIITGVFAAIIALIVLVVVYLVVKLNYLQLIMAQNDWMRDDVGPPVTQEVGRDTLSLRKPPERDTRYNYMPSEAQRKQSLRLNAENLRHVEELNRPATLNPYVRQENVGEFHGRPPAMHYQRGSNNPAFNANIGY